MKPDPALRLADKQLAAARAAILVEDGMALGIGSGTTAAEFVRALAPRVAAGLRVRGVATSERTAALARQLGVPLGDLDGPLDLAVDGADAIERDTLHAIKGLGGALTREKLVALAARRFVLIADRGKLTARLVDRPDLPVPIEVLPFGWRLTHARLRALGDPVVRMRGDASVITDNGNLLLDLFHADLRDPEALARALDRMPGVIEHGLFLSIASMAIVADDGVVQVIPE